MKVLLVGDTHGNVQWWEDVVAVTAADLGVDAIVQVGDFGYWPGHDDMFLDAVKTSPVPVFFVDGNHENHSALRHDVLSACAAHQIDESGPVPLGGSLMYLPRGARWVWDGVTCGALGGARSIDRAARIPGTSWFWQEALSVVDMETHVAAGRCDVLFTHDAPASAQLPLLPRHTLSAMWTRELEVCDAHRLLLDEAIDSAQPKVLVHGHYHRRWGGWVERPWGRVQVWSLAEDGTDVPGNMAVMSFDNGTVAVHVIPPA